MRQRLPGQEGGRKEKTEEARGSERERRRTQANRTPTIAWDEQPVIPLSIHGYEEIVCHICNFAQPLANRPDVQQMRGGGGGGGGQGIPMQNQGPPQGWTGGPPPQGGPPNKQQPMRYG